MQKKAEQAGGRKRSRRAEYIFLAAILAYPLIHFAVFFVGVNFNSILLAFQRYDSNYDLHWNGFRNFADVVASLKGSSLLGTSVWNSFRVFFWTTVIGFPCNIFFSYYLYKRVPGHQVVRFIVMLPSIISGMVMSLLFVKFVSGALPRMFLDMGVKIPDLLYDPQTSFPTIIFYTLWTGFTSSLILYPNAMNAIPMEVIESAQLDGANSLREIWHIILPLIYPTVTTFFVTGVAGLLAFSGPLFAFYYYNAPPETYTSGYFLFVQVMASDGVVGYPFAAAAGLLFTLISAPLTMLTKYCMEKFGPNTEM